jgi:hypothetical protein
MAKHNGAEQGKVLGMVVKVLDHRDGTTTFDVVCHNSRGVVAHREKFLLPPKSPLRSSLAKGRRTFVRFLKTGKERDRPVEVLPQ